MNEPKGEDGTGVVPEQVLPSAATAFRKTTTIDREIDTSMTESTDESIPEGPRKPTKSTPVQMDELLEICELSDRRPIELRLRRLRLPCPALFPVSPALWCLGDQSCVEESIETAQDRQSRGVAGKEDGKRGEEKMGENHEKTK